jgi:hypothetical protein
MHSSVQPCKCDVRLRQLTAEWSERKTIHYELLKFIYVIRQQTSRKVTPNKHYEIFNTANKPLASMFHILQLQKGFMSFVSYVSAQFIELIVTVEYLGLGISMERETQSQT